MSRTRRSGPRDDAAQRSCGSLDATRSIATVARMSLRTRIVHVAGLVLGVALFGGALWLLHRELHHYDVHVLIAAARAVPREAIAIALLCTVASYLVLTLY